jgi:hypothetical protein
MEELSASTRPVTEDRNDRSDAAKEMTCVPVETQGAASTGSSQDHLHDSTAAGLTNKADDVVNLG